MKNSELTGIGVIRYLFHIFFQGHNGRLALVFNHSAISKHEIASYDCEDNSIELNESGAMVICKSVAFLNK